MRLIHVPTGELEEFLGSNIPRYAILSHTWGDDEVSFRDYDTARLSRDHSAGMKKIEGCCALARKANIDYAWVDTCCIDKSSSAELSEAINSMYRWYGAAEICYTYMFDMYRETKAPAEDTASDWVDRHNALFTRCKWFTRGWTLQELLAPAKVEFYDANWLYIGDKCSMAALISKRTGIDAARLANTGLGIHGASIAQRMSWAAHRKTTRIEDMAYCLLGILDVNMPLLYGEAEKAFQRLQHEIIRQPSHGLLDESIFAWKDDRYWTSGMLAESPSNFARSGNIVPVKAAPFDRPTYSMTSEGLQIWLVSLDDMSDAEPFDIPLRCRDTCDPSKDNLVALQMRRLAKGLGISRAIRMQPFELRKVDSSELLSKQRGGKREQPSNTATFYVKDVRYFRFQHVGPSIPIKRPLFIYLRGSIEPKHISNVDLGSSQDAAFWIAGFTYGKADSMYEATPRGLYVFWSHSRHELDVYFQTPHDRRWQIKFYRPDQGQTGGLQPSQVQVGATLVTEYFPNQILVLALSEISYSKGSFRIDVQIVDSFWNEGAHHLETLCNVLPDDVHACEYSIYNQMRDRESGASAPFNSSPSKIIYGVDDSMHSSLHDKSEAKNTNASETRIENH